jgi:exosortase
MKSPLTIASPLLRSLLAILLCVFIFIIAFHPYAAGYADQRMTLLAYILQQWSDPTWQHGFVVPGIITYLIWRQHSLLTTLQVQPSPWGLPILLLAALSYFIGYRANNFYFGKIALQLGFAGSVLWLLGRVHMKHLFFPWLVLAFAWPLRFLEDTLGFQLRVIMVQAVTYVVQLFELPIIRDGTSLLSVNPDGRPSDWLNLNVEGPCSGMRSLFALMLVSMLFSHFAQPTLLRRLSLFATSIPLAIVGNMTRLFLLIGGTALFGQSFAVGDQTKEVSTFHFFSGLAVFVVAVVGLQLVSSSMNRWWPGGKSGSRTKTARVITRQVAHSGS